MFPSVEKQKFLVVCMLDPRHVNFFFWDKCTYRFHYMAIADNRQRHMPLPDDRLPGRCEALATPEAVLLVEPVEPEFKGEVLFFFCFTDFLSIS